LRSYYECIEKKKNPTKNLGKDLFLQHLVQKKLTTTDLSTSNM